MEALDSEGVSALDCAELSGNEGLCRWMLENLPHPKEDPKSDASDDAEDDFDTDLRERAHEVALWIPLSGVIECKQVFGVSPDNLEATPPGSPMSDGGIGHEYDQGVPYGSY